MLVPDEATSLWDVEGWAGCGEAELVPVGRGREYKEGKYIEENRKTEKKKKNKRWAGRLQGAVAWFSACYRSQCEKMEAGNRVVIGTNATEMRTRAPR